MSASVSAPTQTHRAPSGAGIDLDQVSVVTLEGRWYRQTAPRYGALSLPHRASRRGRCHRQGKEARLYASSTRNTAWAELFRHTTPEVSPFEVKRRMSELWVAELPVVDFLEPETRAMFDVTERALISNNVGTARKLTDLLRQRPDRFGGLVLPSAAVPGEETLVVFREWIESHVFVEKSRVSTPSLRLLRLLESVIETLPPIARTSARRLLLEIRRELAARLDASERR